ncbi:MAG: hypothetical protein E5W55_25055 [Mesorhizobium sp.]|nr:MAG: hypothetical protein E5W55_25055 [Mesorhizobium sp.]
MLLDYAAGPQVGKGRAKIIDRAASGVASDMGEIVQLVCRTEQTERAEQHPRILEQGWVRRLSA